MGHNKTKKRTSGVLYREVGADNSHAEILNRSNKTIKVTAYAFDWEDTMEPELIKTETLTIPPGTRATFDSDATRHFEVLFETDKHKELIINLYFRDRDNCSVGNTFYNNEFVDL
ncbi:hypothetical protein WAK64_12250 [Bacillus spongiae]|uniref:Uncharacterized protein n=1 Tax=Bacillus spongiae TaxID=2683610 RepID=A0ABU8HEP1_9BACI